MKNQELAHEFAHATEDQQGSGSSYFYNGNTIYSFGTHFIIARKVRDENKNVLFVLFNENKYSGYTSCHQGYTQNALYQKIYFVTTDINNFNALAEIKAQELKMFELAKKYDRARAEHVKNSYLHDILFCVETIEFLAKHYKVKSKVPSRIKQYYDLIDTNILEVLGVSAKNHEKAQKNANTRAENQRIIENSKKAEKEKGNIELWKSHDKNTISLRVIKSDFLRISKDGLNIETTQGVEITVIEAKRLLKLIDNKKIIGAKINDRYNSTVTGFNGYLKAGCHNVSIEEINSIRAKIQ